jgi:hypothetical protein
MFGLLTILAAATQAGSSAGGDAAIPSLIQPHRPPSGERWIFAFEINDHASPQARNQPEEEGQ